MQNIDQEDSEFVALAILKQAPIWSYDPDYKRQNKVKVVGSDYILHNCTDIPTLWEALKEDYSKI